MYNEMEEKNFSSESENENEKETEMINSKYFRKVLREKITNCLNEERKKSKKLDKILFEIEIEKFGLAVKDIKSKRGRPLKSLTKLEDLIQLYSSLMDIDKKMSDIKSCYLKYFDDDDIDLFYLNNFISII